jgi:hypothetical protein
MPWGHDYEKLQEFTMAKRGRWSPQDQRAVVPGAKGLPLPAPPELGEREREIWASIVEKLPGDWFSTETQPLLKELCRHIRISDDLTQDLEAVRAALAGMVRGSSPEMPGLLRDYYALLRAHGYQSERIGNLGTKLRLTNQAKILATSAARKAREEAPKGPEPWEDWGADRPMRQ